MVSTQGCQEVLELCRTTVLGIRRGESLSLICCIIYRTLERAKRRNIEVSTSHENMNVKTIPSSNPPLSISFLSFPFLSFPSLSAHSLIFSIHPQPQPVKTSIIPTQSVVTTAKAAIKFNIPPSHLSPDQSEHRTNTLTPQVQLILTGLPSLSSHLRRAY